MKDNIILIAENEEYAEAAEELAAHLESLSISVRVLNGRYENLSVSDSPNENPLILKFGINGLSLSDGRLEMQGDFTHLIKRLRPENLNGEFLVKAARLKNGPEHPLLIDATAGMGEDSLLLAASGFRVVLFEYNPVIAALLKDTVKRALKNPELFEIASRMTVVEENSIDGIRSLSAEKPDVIFLDPMFPKREKSALIKKKFQLLHRLEMPCVDEAALLNAAMEAAPRKIIIKRPLKGPFLAGVKPGYSLNGKAVRIDCILPQSRTL